MCADMMTSQSRTSQYQSGQYQSSWSEGSSDLQISLKGANSTRSAHLTTWIWGCSFLSHFTIKFLTCCLRVRLKSRPASYLVGGRISRTVNT